MTYPHSGVFDTGKINYLSFLMTLNYFCKEQTPNAKLKTSLYFCGNVFMSDSTLLYSILIGAVLIGLLIYFYRIPKTKTSSSNTIRSGSASLQLQAYERLLLLADRISLPNLINRTAHEGLTSQNMQLVLTRGIRDEFDYNITQQLYVIPECWNALKRMKEKNLLIINQMGSQLPNNATGLDLNRAILTYLMKDDKANLHELVSEALSFEAQKLL